MWCSLWGSSTTYCFSHTLVIIEPSVSSVIIIIKVKAVRETMSEKIMTSMDVINFYIELDNLGIEIWIDGGWGVDALLGE